MKFLIPLCAAGAIVSTAAAQSPQPGRTARELFYAAGGDSGGSRTPDKGGKSAPKGGSKSGSPKGTDSGTIAKGGSSKGDGSGGSHAGTGGGTQLPDGGRIINASAGPPIGITYTLERKNNDGMLPVSPSAVFHKGDLIDFVVQTNYAGYLYIGNKGPSGDWTTLFPSREIDNGDNRVEAFRKYTMPPGKYKITFDEKTGEEQVFILFSREPVADFEKLMYADGSGAGRKAGDPKPTRPLSIAQVNLPESTIDRLRNAFSRDLLIEKIDDDKPGDRQEKAVYIVNPTGASDSHVWADIRLVHK